MVEILGVNLTPIMENLESKATQTYVSSTKGYPAYEVWELEDESYEVLRRITEEGWNQILDFINQGSAWWRHCKGSKLKKVNWPTVINGKEIMTWDLGFEKDCEFEDLIEYVEYVDATLFEREEFSSKCTSIADVVFELAKQNDLDLTSLFFNYQP